MIYLRQIPGEFIVAARRPFPQAACMDLMRQILSGNGMKPAAN
jgi:hypothetical protein